MKTNSSTRAPILLFPDGILVFSGLIARVFVRHRARVITETLLREKRESLCERREGKKLALVSGEMREGRGNTSSNPSRSRGKRAGVLWEKTSWSMSLLSIGTQGRWRRRRKKKKKGRSEPGKKIKGADVLSFFLLRRGWTTTHGSGAERKGAVLFILTSIRNCAGGRVA
ncbi:hypothetical protein R1flu_003445 [Riccia fluitans]|uniref:Transmembrane protein n=1 Tax=Riccia fluitans TaxID=41844 RepID=A0ABD1Y9L5_9MARC